MSREFLKFGILTIVFWLSFISWFFVYPLPLDIWMAEAGFWFSVTAILIGVLSGTLLIVHPTSGRWLVIILCSVMIIQKMGWFMFPLADIGKKLYTTFVLVLPWRPLFVLHHDVIALVFYVISIVILWRRSVAQPPA